MPSGVLSQKDLTEDNVLHEGWYLQGETKFQAMPTKQDLGTSQKFFSKFLTSITAPPLP